jgi:hypothetical protein
MGKSPPRFFYAKSKQKPKVVSGQYCSLFVCEAFRATPTANAVSCRDEKPMVVG